MLFQDLTNTLGLKCPFFHYNEAENTVICHSCMKMFKEKKNKNYIFCMHVKSLEFSKTK